jgi:hypothetical protein
LNQKEKKMKAMKPQTVQYNNSGLEIKIGEAQIVAMSPEGMKWEGAHNDFGNWTFPSIWRECDGRIAVSFNTHHDSALNYGLPGEVYFSTDNGRHWQCASQQDSILRDISSLCSKPIDIPGGQKIAVVPQRPYKTEEINLPERPLNNSGELHWPWQDYVYYRIGDFPTDVMAMKLLRRKPGQEKWATEKSYIDWPEWTVGADPRGIVPVPFFIGGNILTAPDNSLLAMIENMQINKENRAISKYKIICLRSTNRGHTWQYWGETSLPDLELDKETSVELCELTLSLYEPRSLFIESDNLICVARSSLTRTLDHSMVLSRSADMGKSWSAPEKITPFGVYPQLLKLKNGVIVLSYGRPGVHLRFSTDNGKTWGSPITTHGRKPEGLSLTEYREIRYGDTCGYTGLLSTSPDEFLLVYADTSYHDEKDRLRKRIMVREIDVERTKSEFGNQVNEELEGK